MTTERKKKLGQFYTTNYEYILQDMFIPEITKYIIEPFAGKGDLLEFVKKFGEYKLECYDIEPKADNIVKKDTLFSPPEYKNKFIITNPPYLARNKSKDKTLFDKYGTNDLYKCLIKELLTNKSEGGILIIPLNFWCSIRKQDVKLRKDFLKVYDILHLNIFEEKVFSDTSYAICSFQFELRPISSGIQLEHTISTFVYPRKNKIELYLNQENNYTIGGNIYSLSQDKRIKITRLTKDNCDSEFITNIFLKCIDDSIRNKINLSIVSDDKIYVDDTEKSSARSYASIIIEPKLSLDKQKILVDKFNKYLNEQREKYNSLFLTNYRESKSIARKRISFNLAFEIINYLLKDMMSFS
jgi:hypothetical protein